MGGDGVPAQAQKRMRRKKILEQLLLLLLRCLLVFLAGVLFARFLGFTRRGEGTAADRARRRPRRHAEHGRRAAARGRPATDAFDEAKRQITDEIMPAAVEATTPQTLHVLRLSELGQPVPRPDPRTSTGTAAADRQSRSGAVNSRHRQDEGTCASRSRPSASVSSKGCGRQGTARPAAARDTAKVVHVVSDLRAADWADRRPGDHGTARRRSRRPASGSPGRRRRPGPQAGPQVAAVQPTTSPSWSSSRATASSRSTNRSSSRCA